MILMFDSEEELTTHLNKRLLSEVQNKLAKIMVKDKPFQYKELVKLYTSKKVEKLESLKEITNEQNSVGKCDRLL